MKVLWNHAGLRLLKAIPSCVTTFQGAKFNACESNTCFLDVTPDRVSSKAKQPSGETSNTEEEFQ